MSYARITDTARKRGIADEAIRHATCADPGTNNVTIFIGADHTGRLLEIGVKDLDTDNERIVHAMELRPAFYKFL